MATAKKWSGEVTEHSNAMDLEHDIFKSGDPDKIAHSLKESAEKSDGGKHPPSAARCRCLPFTKTRGQEPGSKRQRGTGKS